MCTCQFRDLPTIEVNKTWNRHLEYRFWSLGRALVEYLVNPNLYLDLMALMSLWWGVCSIHFFTFCWSLWLFSTSSSKSSNLGTSNRVLGHTPIFPPPPKKGQCNLPNFSRLTDCRKPSPFASAPKNTFHLDPIEVRCGENRMVETLKGALPP